MTIEKGKFLNQPVPNPKEVHEVCTSSPQQHEEIKAIMTLWKGKEINNKMPVKKKTQVAPLDFEELSPKSHSLWG